MKLSVFSAVENDNRATNCIAASNRAVLLNLLRKSKAVLFLSIETKICVRNFVV